MKAVFDAFASGATIITATRRLSRELIAEFDHAQIAQGKTAWPGPDCLPWDTWIQRCWQQLSPLMDHPPLALSDGQLEAIWQQIIAEDVRRHHAESEALWNISATTRTAIRSLKLLRAWEIHPEQLRSAYHLDHLSFSRWLAAYYRRCQQENWIDHHLLPQNIIPELHRLPDADIQFVGFDRFTRQQQTMIEALKEHHRVRIVETKPVAPAPTACQVYQDEREQWLAAGRWARDRLLRRADQRIAIVAPDIERSRDLIEDGLMEALCPEQLIDPGETDARPFHLSLGRSLNAYPIVAQGLTLLRLGASRQIHYEQISRVLHSPFIGAAMSEQLPRSVLSIDLGEALPHRFTLSQWIHRIQWHVKHDRPGACPALLQILIKFQATLEARPRRQNLQFWSQWISQALHQLGWPGERGLSSAEHQVMTAFKAALNALAELDFALSPTSYADALDWLERRLKSQLFQIEAGQSPVQVLGVLETAGLAFDAIWLGGLVEQKWPGNPYASPFIPLPLQKQAGIHEASVESWHHLTALQHRRLVTGAGKVVLSRYLSEDDIQQEPSPLLVSLEQVLHQERQPTLTSELNRTAPSLEWRRDDQTTCLDSGTVLAGGTALIASQARCPRGAILRHRLSASVPKVNEQGADAALRGSMVHHALEGIWNELRDSERLQTIGDRSLGELIEEIADASNQRFSFTAGVGKGFLAEQHDWLCRSLHEWLALEQTRHQPFTVSAVEHKETLSLSGLSFNFKLDRIDTLDDGGLVLIDYKTTTSNSVNDWIQPRPIAPQLPLYALTQSAPIRAMAYGRVKLGQCQLVGLSDGDQVSGDHVDIKIIDLSRHRVISRVFENWQQLCGFWRQSLESIAAEMLAGEGGIDPQGNGICQYCQTPSFCRSGARAAYGPRL